MRKKWIAGVLFLVGILGEILSANHDIKLTDFQLRQQGAAQLTPVDLPFKRQSAQPPLSFHLEGKLFTSSFFSGKLKITPDDCLTSIKINGLDVPLTSVPTADLCDWRNGFELDVKNYVRSGENQVSLELSDPGGGQYGLGIEENGKSILTNISAYVSHLLLLGTVLFFLWEFIRLLKTGAFPFYDPAYISKKKKKIELGFFLAITLISYFTYFHGYDQPASVFWDENYHIASAQKYLNGTFFMEPHPPLGKLLIALGEKIIHPNAQTDQYISTDYATNFPGGFSFKGFRFFPTLFAWLTAPLIFLVFQLICGSSLWAFLFSFLYVFDNALIVHNRGAMIEGILLFLTVLMTWVFLLLIKSKDLNLKRFNRLSLAMGASFGLVMTTKMVGLSLILLVPAVLFHFRDDLKKCTRYLGAFGLGFLITFVTVWQIHFSLAEKINPKLSNQGFYQASNSYREQVNRKETSSLFGFSTRLHDSIYFGTVGYQKGVPTLDLCKPGENGSPPFYWPFGARSINYRWDSNGNQVRYLYLQSNPVVWLCGLLGVLLSLVFAGSALFFGVADRIQNRFLIYVFLALYCGYMFAISQVSRVMYLYHYFMPLFFSFVLFALIFMDLNEVAKKKIDPSIKFTVLLLISVAILASFWFYSPFTYHLPLTRAEFQMRQIIQFWGLKPSP